METNDGIIPLIVVLILFISSVKIFLTKQKEPECIPLSLCAKCAFGQNGTYREICQYKFSDAGDFSFYLRNGDTCTKLKTPPQGRSFFILFSFQYRVFLV